MLGVLYLIFNEGYAATDDDSLLRPDLMAEAIRLARLSAELLPADAEARGLLALMLLTDARRAARTTAAGDLVPLDDQDRSLWNRAQIDEGVRLLDDALAMRRPGPYQTQAAIAALHSTAATAPRHRLAADRARSIRPCSATTPTPVVELNAGGRAGHVQTACRTRLTASRVSRRAATWRAITCCRPPRPTCCGGWDDRPRPPRRIARRWRW